MFAVTEKSVSLNGSEIRYRLIKGRNLEVVRLQADVRAAAEDFSSFYAASGRDARAIIGTSVERVSEIAIPRLLTKDHEERTEFLSFRALISYWSNFYIKHIYGDLKLSEQEVKRYNIIVEFFDYCISNKIVFVSIPGNYGGAADLRSLVLNKAGYLHEVKRNELPHAVIAAGYWVLGDEECHSPYQSICDPIGFRVQSDRITSVPLYGRPSFLQTNKGFMISKLDLSNLNLHIPACGLCFSDKDRHEGGTHQIYSPKGASGELSPMDDNKIDLIVVENAIVAIRDGGGTRSPLTGIVLNVDKEVLSDNELNAIRENNSVEYSMTCGTKVHSAVQCGPTLVSNNRRVDLDKVARVENFFTSYIDPTSIPVGVQDSLGSVKAARSAIGLVSNDEFVAIIVEGTASGVGNGNDNLAGKLNAKGISFAELTELALSEGLSEAIALDSGGSVGLFVNGEKEIASGDYRNTDERHPRPLAHALIIN